MSYEFYSGTVVGNLSAMELRIDSWTVRHLTSPNRIGFFSDASILEPQAELYSESDGLLLVIHYGDGDVREKLVRHVERTFRLAGHAILPFEED